MENKKSTYKYPLLLLIGPSGSGKDTIMQLIKKKMDIAFSPTFTTREKREYDSDNISKFISIQEFKDLIKKRAFLDYNFYIGNYYGTKKDYVLELIKNKPVIQHSDINGVKKIKNNPKLNYDSKEHTININTNKIKIYFLGILMESIEHTKRTLINRDGDNAETKQRVELIPQEYDFIKKNADYCIINYYNKQEQCADEFVKLIKKLINNN